MGRGSLQKKRNRKKNETKYDRLQRSSDSVFKGLEKLLCYVTQTSETCKNSDLSPSVSSTSSILKGRTIMRVYSCKLVS